MNSLEMVLVDLEQLVQNKKRSNEFNGIKNFKKLSKVRTSWYATYLRTFLKQLLNKSFEPTKENANIENNLCLLDKVIYVIQLLALSDGEIFCCC